MPKEIRNENFRYVFHVIMIDTLTHAALASLVHRMGNRFFSLSQNEIRSIENELFLLWRRLNVVYVNGIV